MKGYVTNLALNIRLPRTSKFYDIHKFLIPLIPYASLTTDQFETYVKLLNKIWKSYGNIPDSFKSNKDIFNQRTVKIFEDYNNELMQYISFEQFIPQNINPNQNEVQIVNGVYEDIANKLEIVKQNTPILADYFNQPSIFSNVGKENLEEKLVEDTNLMYPIVPTKKDWNKLYAEFIQRVKELLAQNKQIQQNNAYQHMRLINTQRFRTFINEIYKDVRYKNERTKPSFLYDIYSNLENKISEYNQYQFYVQFGINWHYLHTFMSVIIQYLTQFIISNSLNFTIDDQVYPFENIFNVFITIQYYQYIDTQQNLDKQNILIYLYIQKNQQNLQLIKQNLDNYKQQFKQQNESFDINTQRGQLILYFAYRLFDRKTSQYNKNIKYVYAKQIYQTFQHLTQQSVQVQYILHRIVKQYIREGTNYIDITNPDFLKTYCFKVDLTKVNPTITDIVIWINNDAYCLNHQFVNAYNTFNWIPKTIYITDFAQYELYRKFAESIPYLSFDGNKIKYNKLIDYLTKMTNENINGLQQFYVVTDLQNYVNNQLKISYESDVKMIQMLFELFVPSLTSFSELENEIVKTVPPTDQMQIDFKFSAKILPTVYQQKIKYIFVQSSGLQSQKETISKFLKIDDIKPNYPSKYIQYVKDVNNQLDDFIQIFSVNYKYNAIQSDYLKQITKCPEIQRCLTSYQEIQTEDKDVIINLPLNAFLTPFTLTNIYDLDNFRQLVGQGISGGDLFNENTQTIPQNIYRKSVQKCIEELMNLTKYTDKIFNGIEYQKTNTKQQIVYAILSNKENIQKITDNLKEIVQQHREEVEKSIGFKYELLHHIQESDNLSMVIAGGRSTITDILKIYYAFINLSILDVQTNYTLSNDYMIRVEQNKITDIDQISQLRIIKIDSTKPLEKKYAEIYNLAYDIITFVKKNKAYEKLTTYAHVFIWLYSKLNDVTKHGPIEAIACKLLITLLDIQNTNSPTIYSLMAQDILIIKQLDALVGQDGHTWQWVENPITNLGEQNINMRVPPPPDLSGRGKFTGGDNDNPDIFIVVNLPSTRITNNPALSDIYKQIVTHNFNKILSETSQQLYYYNEDQQKILKYSMEDTLRMKMYQVQEKVLFLSTINALNNQQVYTYSIEDKKYIIEQIEIRKLQQKLQEYSQNIDIPSKIREIYKTIHTIYQQFVQQHIKYILDDSLQQNYYNNYLHVYTGLRAKFDDTKYIFEMMDYNKMFGEIDKQADTSRSPLSPIFWIIYEKKYEIKLGKQLSTIQERQQLNQLLYDLYSLWSKIQNQEMFNQPLTISKLKAVDDEDIESVNNNQVVWEFDNTNRLYTDNYQVKSDELGQHVIKLIDYIKSLNLDIQESLNILQQYKLKGFNFSNNLKPTGENREIVVETPLDKILMNYYQTQELPKKCWFKETEINDKQQINSKWIITPQNERTFVYNQLFNYIDQTSSYELDQQVNYIRHAQIYQHPSISMLKSTMGIDYQISETPQQFFDKLFNLMNNFLVRDKYLLEEKIKLTDIQQLSKTNPINALSLIGTNVSFPLINIFGSYYTKATNSQFTNITYPIQLINEQTIKLINKMKQIKSTKDTYVQKSHRIHQQQPSLQEREEEIYQEKLVEKI